MLKISVIIPTYERFNELSNCIKSILSQTKLPDELIIVDDGHLHEIPYYKEIIDSNIVCIYKNKEKKGVTYSRNLGARIATGDIIFLLEDDIILLENFIEEIVHVYQKPGYEDVGGVGGVTITTYKYYQNIFLRFILNTIYTVFLLRSIHPARVLPSGFDSADFDVFSFKDGLAEVDFLPGGVCSYRKVVLNEFEFSSKYQDESGYAQGEDRDFGYRVSRKYRLIVNPRAKVYHLKAGKHTYGNKKKGMLYVTSRYQFFKEHLSDKKWRYLLFAYSLIGYLFIRTILAGLSMDKGEFYRVKGILEGIKTIVYDFIHNK